LIEFYQTETAVYAIGRSGEIYTSTDNGVNWQESSNGLNASIYSASFISPTEIYAGSFSGEVYKTTDGGQSWTPTSTSSTRAIHNLHFTNSNTGFATIDTWSDSLYYTNDTGNNWSPIPLPVTGVWRDIQFTDEQNGWICDGNASNGRIIKTTDGGQTWELMYTSPPFYGMAIRKDGDDEKIWAVGTGGIIEHYTTTIVGLGTPKTHQLLQVFPNPVVGSFLTVQWPDDVSSDVQFQVINTSGKVMMEDIRQTDSTVLDLSILPTGVYFIKAFDASNELFYVNKIVVGS